MPCLCFSREYSLLSFLFKKMNLWFTFFSSVQFSHSVVSNSLQPYGLQYTRLPCPSPTPTACSNSCPSVSDAIQPSHPLSSPSLPVFNLSQHQGLFQWVSSSHQVATPQNVMHYETRKRSSLNSQLLQWVVSNPSMFQLAWSSVSSLAHGLYVASLTSIWFLASLLTVYTFKWGLN